VALDEGGVDKAVVCGFCWSQHETCVEHNDYTIEMIQKYPDRLIGMATIHPNGGARAVAEIERCHKAGIKGIGEWNPVGQKFDLDDRAALAPILEVAAHYQMPIILHTTEPLGHDYKGKHGADLAEVYQLVKHFPDVSIICAHWGGGLPFYELMPEVAAVSQRLYYDTAASPFLYSPAIFRIVPQLVGFRRILFGSDFPLVNHAKFLAQIRALYIARETEEAILGKNALNLFRLD
jgi:predicted TIM-barrel fold metal-dependent hydrolase